MRVFKEGLDWAAECDEHESIIWCGDWDAAMEWAIGHVRFRPHRNLDTRREQEEGSTA